MEFVNVNMPLSPLNNGAGLVKAERMAAGKPNAIEIGGNFHDFLHSKIDQLNSDKQAVDQKTIQFVKGENVEPHDIMIASQKAMLGVELTVQIRNKAVEAYQEIMRLQL